jgi:hypothetical protein
MWAQPSEGETSKGLLELALLAASLERSPSCSLGQWQSTISTSRLIVSCTRPVLAQETLRGAGPTYW